MTVSRIHDNMTVQGYQARLADGVSGEKAKPGFDVAKLSEPRMLYDPLSGRLVWQLLPNLRISPAIWLIRKASDPTQGLDGREAPNGSRRLDMKLGSDKSGCYHLHRHDRGHAGPCIAGRHSQGRRHRGVKGTAWPLYNHLPLWKSSVSPATDHRPNKRWLTLDTLESRGLQ